MLGCSLPPCLLTKGVSLSAPDPEGAPLAGQEVPAGEDMVGKEWVQHRPRNCPSQML